MKFDRQLAAKFESRGFPQATKQVEGNVPEIMAEFASWLRAATMGSRIVLTLTKDAASLSSEDADIAAIFSEQFSEQA